MEPFHHLPVLAAEVMELLAPRPDGIYLDGTLGGGGHSERLLEQIGPKGLLIGIDRDLEAIHAALHRLERFGNRFRAIHGCFGNLGELLDRLGISQIDGLLLDLGVSSHQLDTAERGFSFRMNGPLDMRMDARSGTSAADLVQHCSAEELEQIIREYGEEHWARKIAQRIVRERQQAPLTTTLQLADLVARTIPRRFHEERIHPATRTFQALRIAVNRELEQAEQGIKAGIQRLNPGGRICVISFHSLEDRLVKQLFREAAGSCICPPRLPRCACGRQPQLRIVTRRPVTATEQEAQQNVRARSAKLRVAEKLAAN